VSFSLQFDPKSYKEGNPPQELVGATQTCRQQGDLISLFLCFQNKISRLKMNLTEIGLDDVDWIHLAQGTYQWWAFVNIVMNHQVS
jgi:hypothetical protein